MRMPPAHPKRACIQRADCNGANFVSCNDNGIPKQYDSYRREKYGSLPWLFGTLTVEGKVGVGGKGEVGQAEESEGEGRKKD